MGWNDYDEMCKAMQEDDPTTETVNVEDLENNDLDVFDEGDDEEWDGLYYDEDEAYPDDQEDGDNSID